MRWSRESGAVRLSREYSDDLQAVLDHFEFSDNPEWALNFLLLTHADEDRDLSDYLSERDPACAAQILWRSYTARSARLDIREITSRNL